MRAKANFHFHEIGVVDIPDGFMPWLKQISKEYRKSISLNYIFCSDEYLLEVNRKHLDHDYYTDIITFDLSTVENRIQSDIFISLDRVSENADKESISFAHELTRVMSHGVFHLLGFGDKTSDEALIMRELEQNAIAEIL